MYISDDYVTPGEVAAQAVTLAMERAYYEGLRKSRPDQPRYMHKVWRRAIATYERRIREAANYLMECREQTA